MMTFRLNCKLVSALLLGLVLLTTAVAPDGAFAQGRGLDKKEKEEEEKETAPTSIDAATGKILTEAIDALNAENFPGAAAAIAKLKMDKLSPYERGRVEQILATIANEREDYPAAQKHLQAAVDSGGLNEVEISQARYQIAQLFLTQEKWKEGAAALEAWLSTATNPNSSAYYLLAIAYYQQDLFKQALTPAQKAVDLAEKPQESWLQLVVALHLREENWSAALPLLVRMIGLYPDKKNYWVQLSSVYSQLEQYNKALAIMQLAYDGGLITDGTEVTRLADLLMYNEIPYRCGTLLDDAIAKKQVKVDAKLYQKQSQCWIAAREYKKSLGPLGRAAELSDDGDLFVRMGEVQVQLNEWAAASDAIKRGINKGSLQDLGHAQLMLGIALYNQKECSQAAEWFRKVSPSNKQRKTADGYLQMIRAEACG